MYYYYHYQQDSVNEYEIMKKNVIYSIEAQESLLQGSQQIQSERGQRDKQFRGYDYEKGSLSFIDDLVNLSRKKKPRYVGLSQYNVCMFCKLFSSIVNCYRRIQESDRIYCL